MIKTPDGKGNYINQIVSTVDIAPTLLELAGVKPSEKLDGESLVDLMKNPELNSWRNTAYSYFNQGNSVRTNDYRLTRYHRENGPEYELYDQIQDPNETKNIAPKKLESLENLKEVLEKGNTGIFEK
jgi:arylsulfatase A-like enzyme